MNNDSMPSKLEQVGFYIFLATVILAPLAFWASPYIPLDLVKTFIIAVGTIVSVAIFTFVAIKERRLIMPPKSLSWTSILIVISLIISSVLSIHFGKSFFGQRFELANASFLVLLFISGLTAFTIVGRQKDRAVVLYVGIVATYIIVYLFQLLRIIFGVKFMSLGILNTITSSIIGTWSNLGSFSMLIVIVSLLALSILTLSSRMKIIYWVLLAISAIGTIVVSDMRIWQVATLVFLGLAIFFSRGKWNTLRRTSGNEGKFFTFWKSLAWIPVIAFVLSAIFVWKGSVIVAPVAKSLNIGQELLLPWQMTLDVTASAMQNYPLFGVGPNHFAQAYMAYKPTIVNTTDFWGAEFATGFGLIPTFVATQGLVGSILWILLFIFFGIIGAKVLKNLPQEADRRFMVVSSYTMVVFLWLMAIVSVPSHAILFYAFILTGVFVALATTSGSLPTRVYAPIVGSKMYKVLPSLLAIVILVLVVWGLNYIKKTIAFAYFAGGVKQLTVSNNTNLADSDFTTALKLDESDVYWQAKVETALASAQKLASTVTSATPASTTQMVLTQINAIMNQGLLDAKKATAYDPTNYYNYLSEARISEAAANVQMPNGYENAVQAYGSAINMNPWNPSIYLSLASLEARQKKYDDSLRDLGKALQVKNNYLDAVFLLSQVYAAKGDLVNAIIAAKVAVQLNPQNSLLQFQLGILDYSNKDYAGSAEALAAAIRVQPDYANAKYFLGLSYARLSKNSEAISQFEDLAKSNPDNQEVALILANLRAGKSIFADAKASVTNAPEKRPNLPIKEKR